MGAVMAAEARQQPERATPENWMCPPDDGWTYDQVKDLDLPFDWELVGGRIVVRGVPVWWHQLVRDELYFRLRQVRPSNYMINNEQAVHFDKGNVPKPDLTVFTKDGLGVRAPVIPVENVVLAVEIVSPGSRTDDRFLKPALYAQAGIDYYWRIEQGEDDVPEVHEFWRDPEAGMFVPSPERRLHTGTLKTHVPFPIEVELRSLIDF
ncbi:Uma2 family endonuclease [Streptomyces sp. NPDC049555]|uniref:Uma2 family endonuclease n=1 Tax=Streptomyces sp. NPDC049555 TaxID=3154930 RepID=UPI0034235DFB